MKHATYLPCSIGGQIWPIVSQRKWKVTSFPRTPHPQSLLSPQSSSGKYLKATEVGVPFDVYIGWLLFLFLSFFLFFNNQSSRKCGELTAWQKQRNSLEKLRWILLRFQTLRQELQRNNRLLVVFNHFFCGTFLVHETNLSVRHEGAWEPRSSEWRLWFGDYYSDINYFLLTALWQDWTCPSWRGPWTMLCHCFYFKRYPLKFCSKIVNNVHKTSLQHILKLTKKCWET